MLHVERILANKGRPDILVRELFDFFYVAVRAAFAHTHDALVGEHLHHARVSERVTTKVVGVKGRKRIQ